LQNVLLETSTGETIRPFVYTSACGQTADLLARGELAMDVIGVLVFHDVPGEPVSLSWNVPTTFEPYVVPFEFTDLPLP
ncbi:MAG: hypothetical protein AAF656_14355, partial [Planctomycetota bacterium]